MEEIALESFCSNLTPRQPICVRTSIGRLIKGDFISYEKFGISAKGMLMLSDPHNTFCLPSDQIDRIFLVDDENLEETLSPNML